MYIFAGIWELYCEKKVLSMIDVKNFDISP